MPFLYSIVCFQNIIDNKLVSNGMVIAKHVRAGEASFVPKLGPGVGASIRGLIFILKACQNWYQFLVPRIPAQIASVS